MPKAKQAAGDTPWLEWVVGGFGALVFVVMVGALVSNGARTPDAPPSIETRIERTARVDNGYAVQIVAINQGDITAAQVKLGATLMLPSGETEEREITFDFLPPHSARRGGFLFTQDPRSGALTIEADGYIDP